LVLYRPVLGLSRQPKDQTAQNPGEI
jgi:hypothetical protein